MFWYHTEGQSPAYFIYSAASYHRNIDKHPFHDPEKNAPLLRRIEELLTKNGFHKETLPPGRDPAVLSLVEKQLLGKETADTPDERALYLNEPCNLCLTVGGSELITVRAILPGKAMGECRLIASSAEELLDREFSFAYSDSLGYLTASPALCGSGNLLSAALFLPSLGESSEETALRTVLATQQVSLSPLTTHRGNPGSIWLLTKKVSLSQDEESQVTDFESLCEGLTAKEESSERMKFAEQDTLLTDAACRAYGILTNACLLSTEELLSCTAKLRRALAVADREKQQHLPPLSLQDLNYLNANCLDGTLVADIGKSTACRDRTECQLLRAATVKSYLQKAAETAHTDKTPKNT